MTTVKPASCNEVGINLPPVLVVVLFVHLAEVISLMAECKEMLHRDPSGLLFSRESFKYTRCWP